MYWRVGVLVATWFLAGVAVSYIATNFWDITDWEVVAAIATWLLAGGLIFAILQVQQARKSANAQIAVQLFNELRRTEAVDMIRHIYNLHYDPSHAATRYLREEDKGAIEYILDRLDFLGNLVANGIIDKKLAVEAYAGPAALKCWYRLHKYIERRRDERGYFCDNFEGFAKLCLDHFKKENIQVKFYEEGGEDKGRDLVKVLQQDTSLRPLSLKDIKRQRKH